MYATPLLSIDPLLYSADTVVDALDLINDGEEAAVCCEDLAYQVLLALGLTAEEADVRVAIAKSGTLAVATGAS